MRFGFRPAIPRRKSISATTFPITKTSIPCTERSKISSIWRDDAKKHDIRIIMDFVLNHTSPQHKWFLDSASSRTSAHRDWYIWRDGKAPGVPPNNWISGFGGSAWQFDPKTGQYYYHYFAVGQPDLNWRNPAVEKAMFDVTRFWYKRGVSGFRLDAVDLLFEDPNLHDNPVLARQERVRRSQHAEQVQRQIARGSHGAEEACARLPTRTMPF